MSCALSFSQPLFFPSALVLTLELHLILRLLLKKIRGDNCILSLHIILEPQKVNFSWIFINHRRIQTTCYVPLWCLHLFFHLLDSYVGDKRPKVGSLCSKNTIIWCTTNAENHKVCSVNITHIHRTRINLY